ncbi:MAG: oligopeptide transport system permease protein [Chthoniobacter sp.]|jgi:peptide/nickel transport system permease protein/oligopeptide transport system permease protein|nr:oligopeptide transport system permease protein [Chthoniobacter sp.]
MNERAQLGRSDTIRRFARNRVAVAAMVLLALVALCAVFGPLLLPVSHRGLTRNQFAPPSLVHPFGTDLNGRDVLYRVLEGARVSLFVGITGALISFCVGTAYGLVAGYAGGKTDAFMMRTVEILYSIPRLIIILIFINAFDTILKKWLALHGFGALIGYSKILILVLSLGLIEWLTMARIVRGQVLSLKAQQFVLAARSLGQSHVRILTKHLLPNLVSVVVIYLTLTVPAVILDESFLSFLGLGIQAPQASWGSLLSDGAQVINPLRSNWWLLVCPAAVMSSTLLALNFLGDALRDALDPRATR